MNNAHDNYPNILENNINGAMFILEDFRAFRYYGSSSNFNSNFIKQTKVNYCAFITTENKKKYYLEVTITPNGFQIQCGCRLLRNGPESYKFNIFNVNISFIQNVFSPKLLIDENIRKSFTETKHYAMIDNDDAERYLIKFIYAIDYIALQKTIFRIAGL